MLHAVGLEDLAAIPPSVIVEVVQGEERGWVEVADMMLFCRGNISEYWKERDSLDDMGDKPAMCRVAQLASGSTSKGF